jgi:hypothetical protein
LLIGEKDTTAIGKHRAPPELAKTLGNYPVLAREAHARIKGSTLVTFPDLGHAPQVQDAARFNRTLLEGLSKLPRGGGARPRQLSARILNATVIVLIALPQSGNFALIYEFIWNEIVSLRRLHERRGVRKRRPIPSGRVRDDSNPRAGPGWRECAVF